MPADQTLAVRIELQANAEPIAGSLRVDGEPASQFRGWLQLTSLLQAAAHGKEPGCAHSSDAHGVAVG